MPLTEDQRLIQDTARQFAFDRLRPNAGDWDEGSIFPREVIKEAAALGFAGIYVREDVGGSALGRLDAALVFEVIRGPDGKDLSVAPAGFEWDNRTGISGMRIGVLGVDLRKDKAGWTNHAAVVEWMRGAGAVVEDVTLPPFSGDGLGLILMAEASASFEAWVWDGRMDGLVQQDPGSWPNLFRAARLIPAVEYLEANRGRGELAEAMEALKSMGYVLLGLDGEATVTLAGAMAEAGTRPVGIVLGAEGPGLRDRTRDTCDRLVRIPFPGSFGSLNVSNAAAIALYAATQRPVDHDFATLL
jgi:hypothetical protein